jgi:hypothetical protein
MTDKTQFNGWKPIIVKSTEIAKEETPLNKETKDKMREFVKKNSKDKLKEVIKKFYKK